MWFEQLTGFKETTPDDVRAKLSVEGGRLISTVNGKSWQHGELEIISLAELRSRVGTIEGKPNTISEVVANTQDLHTDPANACALFQVASQFNLLEMVGPGFTPEQGVGIYEHDFTQGPACAIACGAGTIYRNYFAPVRGQVGQSTDNQIDCLEELGSLLGNEDQRLWEMRNGYALASESGLHGIQRKLQSSSEAELDAFRAALQVGIQWQSEVTLLGASHLVSQIYCSALPVAYSPHPASLWKEFATLVLEATYESTILAAILNSRQHGSNKLFLTLVGGGAFGNDTDWIIQAIQRAITRYPNAGLDIHMVSYGSPNRRLEGLVTNPNNPS